MLGEGFIVWARAVLAARQFDGSLAARQFDGSSVLAARQFDGAFTIYKCLHACELRARVRVIID